MMQVRIIYHDNARELFSTGADVYTLDESATGGSLLSRIAAMHPNAVSHLDRFKVTRNGRTITPDCFLADGDIVDICMADTAIA